MIVYIEKHQSGGVIVLRARAEGKDGIGDLIRDVWPGGSAFGLTYERWAEVAREGPSLAIDHDIRPDPDRTSGTPSDPTIP